MAGLALIPRLRISEHRPNSPLRQTFHPRHDIYGSSLPQHDYQKHAMRAPGLTALEIAMEERLGLDRVEFRVLNDTQVDPEKPDRPFSQRQLVKCLRQRAEHFGWNKRNPKPARCVTAAGWSAWAWRQAFTRTSSPSQRRAPGSNLPGRGRSDLLADEGQRRG
jgi:hypothetical protein